MKTLSFPGKQVKDLNGLYYDLLKQHFEVENVAACGDCTYVHLHDAEDKDPTPQVEAWLGKPLELPTTKSEIEKYIKTGAEIVAAANEERAAKAAARAAKQAQQEALGIFVPDAEAQHVNPPLPQDLPVLAGSKQTLFSKIFRKLW
jgi:hypothetical protein